MTMAEPLALLSDAFKGAFLRFCVATDLRKTHACFSEEVENVQDARHFESALLNLISEIFQSSASAQDEIPQDAVLINQPSTVLLDRIKKFVDWKRDQINRSNLKEFFDSKESDSCARLALRKMNRSTQIKTAVVENWEGPLEKSILRSDVTENSNKTQNSAESSHKGITGHLRNKSVSASSSTLDSSVEERLNLVEDHVRLPVATKALSLLQRIKACEEKIVSIETNYPFLAFYHFHQCKQFPSIKSFEKDPVTIAPSSKRKIDHSAVSTHAAHLPSSVASSNPPTSSGELTGNSSGNTSPANPSSHPSNEDVYEKLLEAKRKLL